MTDEDEADREAMRARLNAADLGHYYGRDGKPMGFGDWVLAIQDPADLRRVGLTAVSDDVEVSTVWLGMDHNFWNPGPPIIFETMVFGGPLDGELERYATEAAALAGHDRWVAAARDGRHPLADNWMEPAATDEGDA